MIEDAGYDLAGLFRNRVLLKNRARVLDPRVGLDTVLGEAHLAH